MEKSFESLKEALEKYFPKTAVSSDDTEPFFIITEESQNLPGISFGIYFGTDSSVFINCFPVRSILPEYSGDVLDLLNSLNYENRFVKFAVDEAGDIELSVDLLLADDDPQRICRQISAAIDRLTSVLDSNYFDIFLTARCGTEKASDVKKLLIPTRKDLFSAAAEAWIGGKKL